MHRFFVFGMSFAGTLALLILLGGSTAFLVYETEEIPPEPEPEVIIGDLGSSHHHSTFLIFINGELYRFNKPQQYEADPRAHLHAYSFAEIHSHATNVTLGYFLNTVGIHLNKSCLTIEGAQYCSNETHTLKFFVNGKPATTYGNQITADWDKYLISYGNEDQKELSEQLAMVPDPLASPAPEQKSDHIQPELL